MMWTLCSIVFGLVAAVFYKPIAKMTAEQQSRILGFRPKESSYWPFFLIIGIILVVCGVLELLHII